MSFLAGYIEKVRAKPAAEKQPIIFGWTVALTTIIFLIWALSFSLSVANDQDRNEELLAAASRAETVAVAEESSRAGFVDSLTRVVGEAGETIANGFWIAVGMIHR